MYWMTVSISKIINAELSDQQLNSIQESLLIGELWTMIMNEEVKGRVKAGFFFINNSFEVSV